MPSNQISEPIYYNSLYRHGVDEKRRVQIPAKWRTPEPEVLTLVLWPKGVMPEACLLVLPPKEWEALVQKLKAMPFADPKAEALRRFLGKKSDRVTLDKSGGGFFSGGNGKKAGPRKGGGVGGVFGPVGGMGSGRPATPRGAGGPL